LQRKLTFNNPDYSSIANKEWLVTNGIGGFASSTICGANTRRYHGLLVASFHPPTDRRVLVSGIEEKIIAAREEFFASTNTYSGVIHPQGYQFLTSFERIPFPSAEFTCGKHTFTKTIFMRHGKNTTVVEYTNTGDEALLLELIPVYVCRDYHHLFREDPRWSYTYHPLAERLLEIKPDDAQPAFFLRFTAGIFYPEAYWYRNFEYAREKERGLDYAEDAKSIGKISCMLAPGESTSLIFGTTLDDLAGDPDDWKEMELRRLKSLAPKRKDSFLKDLIISGDQFLVKREAVNSYTLIAGYHWFTDWGRDTMIAMRGLVIATGKRQMAKSILKTFLHYLDKGMIPNRFPDVGEKPVYNTIDATLWLFVVLHDYYEAFHDLEFIRSVYDQLTAILEAHFTGTRYHIHVTPEGLLYGGEEGTQLTWMDAKVGDYVVTPRIGCPVEINALWFNALSVYITFGNLLGHPVKEYVKKLNAFKSEFRKQFLNDQGYLHDVVIPGQHPDKSIRPNQVYAISLPYSPLKSSEARKVLKVIHEHLYTPFGLRSLSPADPAFKPVFTGDPWQRDNAYHQGTVWSFLWGEYALAYMHVHQNSAESKKWVNTQARSLEEHFYDEDGLYAISENFDGLNPREGKGCIQQAWSVGNTLLALLHAAG
jgi:predicted glycogen debranching enzyme